MDRICREGWRIPGTGGTGSDSPAAPPKERRAEGSEGMDALFVFKALGWISPEEESVGVVGLEVEGVGIEVLGNKAEWGIFAEAGRMPERRLLVGESSRLLTPTVLR